MSEVVVYYGEPRVFEKGELTMCSSWPHSIHIRAKIRMSGRRKRTVRDALRV